MKKELYNKSDCIRAIIRENFLKAEFTNAEIEPFFKNMFDCSELTKREVSTAIAGTMNNLAKQFFIKYVAKVGRRKLWKINHINKAPNIIVEDFFNHVRFLMEQLGKTKRELRELIDENQKQSIEIRRLNNQIELLTAKSSGADTNELLDLITEMNRKK